jgi:hypothetical protein
MTRYFKTHWPGLVIIIDQHCLFAGESVFLKSQSNYMVYRENTAAHRLRTRLMKSAASLAILLCAAPAMAQSATADEQARIEALEQQLQQVLGVVQSLSQELKALKSSQTEAGDAAPGSAPAQSLSADTLSPLDLSKRLDEVTASVAETNARLDDVEDITFDIDERVGSRSLVRAFDAKSFDLGGMLHTAATFVDGKDNNEFAVNRLTFELFAKAELNDKWSLFVAQAFIRESDINFTDPGARRDPISRPFCLILNSRSSCVPLADKRSLPIFSMGRKPAASSISLSALMAPLAMPPMPGPLPEIATV